MAAAFSSLVGQPRAILSASPTVSFSQIRKPANFPLQNSRFLLVNSSSVPRTCTMAMVGDDNVDPARDDHSINWPSYDHPKVVDVTPGLQERVFTATPYIPVYVMLPMGIINMECEIVDANNLVNQLKILKSANVDGVVVECWWGIVEAHAPERYNWNGYKRLFEIVRDFNLKLRVVMSFHEYGGNVGDDVHIPLPRWVTEIGDKNPDIFFTDKDLRRTHECLTWGVDKERVLGGRTALEVYCDLMRSFRVKFDEFFENGVISEIEIGLGPCGELRYPSHSAKLGWKYPGIGEFQLPGIYWWRNTRSGAAELTAGFYSGDCSDGYSPIASMLKKHEAALNFTCLELRTVYQEIDFPEAIADPERLVWQVLNVAWEAYIPVAGENSRPCYHREGYNMILENAKPRNDPFGRHYLSAFTYLRLSPTLLEKHNFMEFERFVQKMHGVQCNYLSWNHFWKLK
ncbi:PREDICTED: beta-amylase 2, chloroplastic-like isoform X2 [Nicotiana attenuata]|uniref:beta-amylase 2, chloroplastic-like isoform X2 n=1 Tax=Nicotiana attenuata TaxID=49451 RepID=UPI00090465AC|nr:PREDICTED: beta-amylase 2, chloroplastic-like isoform X2 [Nicotiana attenuata]